MPAPEIGQALARASKSQPSIESPDEQSNGSNETPSGTGASTPAADGKGVNVGTGDNNPQATGDGGSDAVNGDAASTTGTQQTNDGTVTLEELPDEDLVALCKAQKIKTPKDADRDQMIAALKAEGITRVTPAPKV